MRFITLYLFHLLAALTLLGISAVVVIHQLVGAILAKALPQAILKSPKESPKGEKKSPESAPPEVNSQPSAPTEAADTSVKDKGACDKKTPSLLSPSADVFLPVGSLSPDTAVKSSGDEKTTFLSASASSFVPGASIVEDAAAKASDEEDASLTHSVSSSPSNTSGDGKVASLSPSYPASSKSSDSSDCSHFPTREHKSAIAPGDEKENSISKISVWASSVQHETKNLDSEKKSPYDSIFTPAKSNPVKISNKAGTVVSFACITPVSSVQHSTKNLDLEEKGVWTSMHSPSQRKSVNTSKDAFAPSTSAPSFPSLPLLKRGPKLDLEGKGVWTSMHAPPQRKSANTSKDTSAPSTPSPVQRNSVKTSTISSTTSQDSITQKREPGKMTAANIDDTAAFMAAARALRLNQSPSPSTPTPAPVTTAAVAAEEVSAQQDDTWKNLRESTGASACASVDGVEASNADSVSVINETGSPAETPKHEMANVSKDALSFATEAGALMAPPEQEEDRENLAVFETWGTPDARGKPAARVRTIIIRGLPSTWATPTKVLSLVHGGLIETISVSPMGTAHIRFCDADACQAFYDKYPNGIDLDKSRKVTVFVEMGKDVDVVSSQLTFNLSVGSTRVVRAVGIDLDVTMTQMIRLATAQNRKLEKIIDSFVPGEARSALFRFCTIADAVRFRAGLNRDIDWEHCNVQYANDPCDVATGMHFD